MAYTTIDDPSAHFHIQLYTGNGSSGNSITNDANAGDFKPDWLWIKPRSLSDNHVALDSTRGQTKRIKINSTDAQDTDGTALITFETDGFDLDTTDQNFNQNSATYVAWQWKANGGSLTTASESGSNVGYSRQVNTTAGFAIIKYTGIGSGAAVIHGMGATPSFFTVKRLSGGGYSWYTYHHKNTQYPHTDNLYLNNQDGTTDNDTVWNDQAPSSTEIKLGTNGGVNEDGVEYIMYAFAEKQGYSKFGVYTGNGDADGPFIYTGFKPAWVLFKRNNGGSENWGIFDNRRNTQQGNPRDLYLMPSASNADSSESDSIDFLSNGFKWRISSGFRNAAGDTFVYVAFAEHPFVSSEGVPVTAG